MSQDVNKLRRQIILAPAAALILRPFASFLNARADAINLPKMFVMMHKCQGQYPGNKSDNWLPKQTQAGIELAPMFSNLESIKDQLTYVAGMDITCFSNLDWHHASKAIFTGAKFNAGGEAGNVAPSHESIDQFIAAKWGTSVLHCDINNYQGNIRDGASQNASWRRTANGVVSAPAVGSLKDAYNEVFGMAKTQPDGKTASDHDAALANAKKSLLDFIKDDITAVKKQVVGAHRAQLEAHLDGFRDVEKKILGQSTAVAFDPSLCKMPGAASFDLNGQSGTKKEIQDLLLKRAALQREFLLTVMRCGARRVFSFTATDDDSSSMMQTYWDPTLEIPCTNTPDVNEGYHFCYWHNDLEKYEKQHILCEKMTTGIFTQLLLDMASIKSGDRNLLQDSLAIYGTTMSYNHSNNAHSFLVAGNAGGAVPGNRLITVGDPKNGGGTGKPHNNLLVSLAQGAGFPEVKTFGEASLCSGGIPGFLKS